MLYVIVYFTAPLSLLIDCVQIEVGALSASFTIQSLLPDIE